MELLLANGASLGSTHKGEFAIHAAAKFGCLACVKALVKSEADVKAMTFEGKDYVKDKTPSILPASTASRQSSVISWSTEQPYRNRRRSIPGWPALTLKSGCRLVAGAGDEGVAG